jgi:hypothetical protein
MSKRLTTGRRIYLPSEDRLWRGAIRTGMSELGQRRGSDHVQVTSALPQKTDVPSRMDYLSSPSMRATAVAA